MKIFYEESISNYFSELRQSLEGEVEAEEEDSLLNMNESEYIQYLVGRRTPEMIEIDWGGVTASKSEKRISASDLSHRHRTFDHGPFVAQIVTFHVSFKGDTRLLRCRPTIRKVWAHDIEILANEFTFDVLNLNNDAEYIRREKDNFIKSTSEVLCNIEDDLAKFRVQLETHAREIIMLRKGKLLKEANMFAVLGVPLKRAKDVPASFVVPIQPKRVVVKKPELTQKSSSPEWALESSDYNEILRVLREFGIAMERHPSIYHDRDEESLRALFLMALTPQFESVTGETFNSTGKTDILIRHEGKNVFVAECKFWSGPKMHSETIDQLLGYLTWRDSKTAILCFVRNKKLKPVLDQIRDRTQAHDCFVRAFAGDPQNWQKFEFHLKEDKTRNVQVAILCLHFPGSD